MDKYLNGSFKTFYDWIDSFFKDLSFKDQNKVINEIKNAKRLGKPNIIHELLEDFEDIFKPRIITESESFLAYEFDYDCIYFQVYPDSNMFYTCDYDGTNKIRCEKVLKYEIGNCSIRVIKTKYASDYSYVPADLIIIKKDVKHYSLCNCGLWESGCYNKTCINFLKSIFEIIDDENNCISSWSLKYNNEIVLTLSEKQSSLSNLFKHFENEYQEHVYEINYYTEVFEPFINLVTKHENEIDLKEIFSQKSLINILKIIINLQMESLIKIVCKNIDVDNVKEQYLKDVINNN